MNFHLLEKKYYNVGQKAFKYKHTPDKTHIMWSFVELNYYNTM